MAAVFIKRSISRNSHVRTTNFRLNFFMRIFAACRPLQSLAAAFKTNNVIATKSCPTASAACGAPPCPQYGYVYTTCSILHAPPHTSTIREPRGNKKRLRHRLHRTLPLILHVFISLNSPPLPGEWPRPGGGGSQG